MGRRKRPWHALLDRAVFGAGALLLTLETLPMLTGWANLAASPRDQGLLGFVVASRTVLIGLAVWAAARGLRGSVLVAGHAAAWSGLVAATLIDWPQTTRSLESEVMVPLWALQAVQLTWLAGARSGRSVGLMVPVTGLAFVALGLPGLPDLTQGFNLVHSTLTSLAVAALVGYLRTGATYADGLARKAREARERAAAEIGGGTARNEAHRLLHDEAISALRAINLGLPPERLRAVCSSALTALALRRVPADRADLLATLNAASPGAVLVRDEGWPHEPPGRVLEALGSAAAEALRNVHRHSGADCAELTATSDGETLVLEVRDRGIGLQRGTAPGFGLTSSITRSMRLVGGGATVSNAPDRGTLVRLTWAPERPRETSATRNPLAAGNRFAGYQLAVAPIALGHLLSSWFQPAESRWVSVTMGLLIGLFVLAATVRFARRAATWGDSLALTVLVCTLTVLGLRNVAPGGLMTLESWAIDFSALLIVLAAFEARAARILLPVAAQVGVVAWASAQDPLVGVADPTGAYFAAVVPVAFAFAVGRMIQRGTAGVLATEATLVARSEEATWQLAAAEARTQLRTDLDARVAPLLAGIAAGDPVDDRIRAEAEALAARLRDTIYFERPLPDTLRSAVAAARARGVVVGFRGQPQAPGIERLTPLVVAALENPHAEVATVFADADPRVVVVPALTPRGGVALTNRYGSLPRISSSTVSSTLRPALMGRPRHS